MPEAYCQLVGFTPVDEVQIEVVLKGRSIKDLAWYFVDFSYSLQIRVPKAKGMRIIFNGVIRRGCSEPQNVAILEGS